jgi:acyl-coenzyme A synthetase/AMP-(fatty) acid ligase
MSELCPVHHLMHMHTTKEWSVYWASCGRGTDPYCHYFPHFIHSVIQQIQSAKAKRVVLLGSDRVLFLAGLLASLHAHVPVILPSSDAKGLLQGLLQEGDLILTDKPLDLDLGRIIVMGDIKPDISIESSFEEIAPSSATITFYTSGSTGEPKPIHKTLKQLDDEVAALEGIWGNIEGTFFSTVPPHHIYGLLFSVLWPVCGGYPFRTQTFSYWEDLLEVAGSDDYLISSPAHLGRFPIIAHGKKPNFRMVFSSGSELSAHASEATVEHLGVSPTEIYGSTETGGIAYRTYDRNNRAWTRFPGVEIWQGENQLLCLRSPYLEGNFETQDRVEIESDDRFILQGRADRIVKIEGKRVSLTEMERCLRSLDMVQEVIAVPLTRNAQGSNRDLMGALVVLTDAGRQVLEDEGKLKLCRLLTAHLRQYFEALVLPKRWRFVDEIPVNSQGKRPLGFLTELFAVGEM